ncbi:carbohydrate sulfotransferase 15-like isoform X2 [Apostichopus japonicus]|uniref:carbohydrate sulfotransferase 15-like isoform X2 n=1 Tax=Stichopus japonicus TaxID=307972 RepID=UPI003AB40852
MWYFVRRALSERCIESFKMSALFNQRAVRLLSVAGVLFGLAVIRSVVMRYPQPLPDWSEDEKPIHLEPEALSEYPAEFIESKKNPCWVSPRGTVDCLPYFYLAGMPKCGTTDIWVKLTKHPQISVSRKEPHWWAKIRVGTYNGKSTLGSSATAYYELWGNLMRKVTMKKGEEYASNTIFGDGSASTFWGNRHWTSFHPNLGRCPDFAIPSLIHSIQPEAKIIVAFRNPIDRLFSDYLYFSSGLTSSEEFHESVKAGIEEFQTCLETIGDLRTCVYKADKLPSGRAVRLRIGLYSVYLEDWLKIFKPSQLRVIRTEDWSVKCPEILTDLHRFLELDELPPGETNDLCNEERHNVGHSKTVALLPETAQLLRDFYSPFNKRLATLLDDDNFIW